jgi:hypothetical protein
LEQHLLAIGSEAIDVRRSIIINGEHGSMI